MTLVIFPRVKLLLKNLKSYNYDSFRDFFCYNYRLKFYENCEILFELLCYFVFLVLIS